MNAEDDGSVEAPYRPGWRDRIWAIGAAAGRLIDTRVAILQEELAEKSGHLGRALAGLFVALLFGTLAGLLLTALLAAVFSRLLGSPIWGILVTLVLYVGIAAAAGWFGVRKLSEVRPFEFPATRREVDRDLESVGHALGVGGARTETTGTTGPGGTPPRGGGGESAEELEARLRESAG